MNSPSPSPSPYSPPYFLYNKHHSTSSIAFTSLIAVASLSLLTLIVILFFLLYNKSKTHRRHSILIDPEDNPSTSISSILLHANSHPLADIDACTNGFHTSHIVGKGPLGTVYKATSISNHIFAVKRIHSHLVLSNAGLEFSSKLKNLSNFTNYYHPNVVPILGYSEAPGERIIITEFVSMRNLDYFLREEILDWGVRLKIAAGGARGIEHLHEGINIVHGRVKPSNILIDDHNNLFCARVCDYGLSFLERGVSGNVGYNDGEGREEGSKENDVYGFGVVLLEILSGRKCEGGLIVEWALPLIRTGRVDEALDKRLGLPRKEETMRVLFRMAKVATACVGNERKSRPSIAQVAAILGNLEMQF